jgi:serine/threonine protein kinase
MSGPEDAPSSPSILDPHDIGTSLDRLITVIEEGTVLCKEYRVIDRIGVGVAAVWSAVSIHTNEQIALKVYTTREAFKREVKFLHKINHHRIVHTLATFDKKCSSNPYCITVLPLGNKSLQEMFCHAPNPSPTLIKFIAEVAP